MWNQKSEMCVAKAQLQKSAANSRFIQRVSEEVRRNEILEDTFMQSSEENPYFQTVRSNIGLCSEIKEEARQRFLEEKRRQQLRENNQELKLLETQLRAAYVSKTIKAQIFEKEANRNETLAKKQYSEETFDQARLRSDEAAKKDDEEDHAKKEALKKILLEQMAALKAKKLKEYEHMLQDKERMTEVARKYREDKEKEVLEAEEKKKKVKAEMDEFLRDQEEWKISQNLATKEEDDKVEELFRLRELEVERIKKEKREQKLRKEQISEEIGNRIHAIAMEKAKARDTLAELLVDERQAKEEMHERKELERQMRDRIATRRELKHEIEEKQRRKLEQQKVDEEIFQDRMRFLAEYDKLDQMSNEKRRRKQIEHRRALLNDLDEKKRHKAESIMNHLRSREKLLSDNKRSQQLVEEERIRMLKEHGSQLLAYLPPGVIRESDRKFLSIP